MRFWYGIYKVLGSPTITASGTRDRDGGQPSGTLKWYE